MNTYIKFHVNCKEYVLFKSWIKKTVWHTWNLVVRFPCQRQVVAAAGASHPSDGKKSGRSSSRVARVTTQKTRRDFTAYSTHGDMLPSSFPELHKSYSLLRKLNVIKKTKLNLLKTLMCAHAQSWEHPRDRNLFARSTWIQDDF